MRHHLAAEGLGQRVTVDSAATHDYHTGASPSGPAVDLAGERGYDMTPLRARRFEPGDFDTYHLILAMDRGHLRILTRQQPPATAARIALFLDYAHGQAAEVPDPYYGGVEDYRDMLDLVEGATPALVARLKRDFL